MSYFDRPMFPERSSESYLGNTVIIHCCAFFSCFFSPKKSHRQQPRTEKKTRSRNGMKNHTLLSSQICHDDRMILEAATQKTVKDLCSMPHLL